MIFFQNIQTFVYVFYRKLEIILKFQILQELSSLNNNFTSNFKSPKNNNFYSNNNNEFAVEDILYIS